MNKKCYVLDTNVYLTDPNALWNYEDNDIIIPFKVLEEIDKHKKRQDIVGSNARRTIKMLDELSKGGNLTTGVKIADGKGVVITRGYARRTYPTLPPEYPLSNPDNEILAVAVDLKKSLTDTEVIMVSRDINMRLKCNSLNLPVEDYELEQVVDQRDQLYSGEVECLMEGSKVDDFYNGIPVYLNEKDVKLYPNQFLLLKDNCNSAHTALARFVSYSEPLKKIQSYKGGLWGVTPRNKEQMFTMDLLMDPSVKVVTLVGKAGTGKTLCALAAGLSQLLEEGHRPLYRRMIVTRPIEPHGRDIGFLPGDVQEKMSPWLAPIQDNLRNLLGDDTVQLDSYVKDGIIEIEAMTYIRGRSISNAYIIIDETQNLTIHELKTMITRVGEGTKIILTGDIEQIDNAFVNEFTNGLTHAVEKFKNSEICGHITLLEGERSDVASLAAKIL